MKFKYHKNTWFNETDTYLFVGGYRYFVSKVELYNGTYYTLENLQYKCSSVECKKLPRKNF